MYIAAGPKVIVLRILECCLWVLEQLGEIVAVAGESTLNISTLAGASLDGLAEGLRVFLEGLRSCMIAGVVREGRGAKGKRGKCSWDY